MTHVYLKSRYAVRYITISNQSCFNGRNQLKRAAQSDKISSENIAGVLLNKVLVLVSHQNQRFANKFIKIGDWSAAFFRKIMYSNKAGLLTSEIPPVCKPKKYQLQSQVKFHFIILNT